MVSKGCSGFFCVLCLNMIVKKERHLRIMTAALQTHHKVTTTQTYPTEIRSERENLLNTMTLMHLDIDLLGLSRADGKRTNKTDKIWQINFNGGGRHACAVQIKNKKTTKLYNKICIKNKKVQVHSCKK